MPQTCLRHISGVEIRTWSHEKPASGQIAETCWGYCCCFLLAGAPMVAIVFVYLSVIFQVERSEGQDWLTVKPRRWLQFSILMKLIRYFNRFLGRIYRRTPHLVGKSFLTMEPERPRQLGPPACPAEVKKIRTKVRFYKPKTLEKANGLWFHHISFIVWWVASL